MKKKPSFGMNIGASSVLVIIIILTLICFAGLSLASSSADHKLCLKLSDRTSDYYRATSEAYKAIYEAQKREPSKETSLNENFAINDNQALRVSAIINPGNSQNYQIKEFRIVTVKKEDSKGRLSLLLR